MTQTNKSILDYALEYNGLGWCVIPIGFNKMPPKGFSWMKYQSTQSSEDELRKWFGAGKYKSLAVICGQVSGGLTILDFDRMDLYDKWKAENPQLAEKLPTVKTSRGRHVYFRSGLSKSKKFHKIDLLSERKYALLPPSLHPDGPKYEWLTPLNGYLPELNPLKWNLEQFTEEREETDEIEEIDETEEIEAIGVFFLGGRNICLLVEEGIKCTQPKDEGQRNSAIFKLCRCLKGIPELADRKPKDLKDIVRQWHDRAKPVIGTKPFDDTWADFTYGWPRVKWPKGDETLTKAIEKALKAKGTLPEAEQYDSDESKLLVRVCFELQKLTGEEPFWLSCYSAANILGVSHTKANKMIQMLVSDEILTLIEKNTTKRATRYRYLAG